MKRTRFQQFAGAALLLAALFLTACGGDSLKATFYTSREEPTAPEQAAGNNPETNCSTLNPHPLAESMAGKFEISYEEIMTWYCDGYAFSDILLALETEQLVDQSAEDLLSLLADRSWEEIWQDLGLEPQ